MIGAAAKAGPGRDGAGLEEPREGEPGPSGVLDHLAGGGAGVFFLVAIAVAVYAMLDPVGAGAPGALLAVGVALVAFLVGASVLVRAAPHTLLFGSISSPGSAADAGRPATAALAAAGVEGRVLDADPDGCLVARRDGVVVYANAAYVDLARSAGASGLSGLPPRIDRLFASSGEESARVFRLCRAAQSGRAARETVTLMLGVDGRPRLRRFDIATRPLPRGDGLSYWRVRELPVEEASDALAAAYADLPRPIIAVEKTGRVAWANAAARRLCGAEADAPLSLDRLTLGDSAGLLKALLSVDGERRTARIRSAAGDAVEADFTPFRRGGVGDGFVCVEIDAEPEADVGAPGLSEHMAEAPFGVALVDGDLQKGARLMETNKTFAATFRSTSKGASLRSVFPAEVVRDLAAAAKARSAKARASVAATATAEVDGETRHFHLFLRSARRKRGSYGGRRHTLFSVDITDHKRMEDAYAQDQKLKAIGQLAGGVAHDFNNMLQVVLGNCEILMQRHAAGDPDHADLVLIQQNAQRAANLTSKLLAFSRKQTLRSEVLSIADVLRDFTPFLHRTLTERVKLRIEHGRETPLVKADKGQLEVAIMNLAVNARDAMEAGGELIISTGRIDAAAAEARGLASVEHLLVAVRDTGPGIPQEIADKIFEPYFTTKPAGKGTGLGLATVHGVVGQMGGAIDLESAPGEGATFRIYLPAHDGEAVGETGDGRDEGADAAAKAPTADQDLTGDARLLVVEDEEAVRTFVVRALQMCGYRVDSAEDGVDALEMVEAEPGAYDLVMTDVMMPDLDGPGFVKSAGEKLGAAKVIFMSGYAETEARDKLGDFPHAAFLKKPFNIKAAAALVKEVLGA